MGPNRKQADEEADEEAVAGSELDGQQGERYHDDSDEDATIGADTPFRTSTERTSTEYGGLRLGGSTEQTWRDRITDRLPPWAIRAWERTATWVKGPDPPRIFTITPVFPKIQHAPIALLDHYAPKKIHCFWLLMLLYGCWLLAFSLVLQASSFSASIPGYGSPVRVGCGAQFWNEGNGCGLNGNRCRPFSNDTFAFRCPADCHKTQILNPLPWATKRSSTSRLWSVDQPIGRLASKRISSTTECIEAIASSAPPPSIAASSTTQRVAAACLH